MSDRRQQARNTADAQPHAPEQPQQPDRGANGPAALARPRSFEQVATGDRRWGREAVDAVRYRDTHPWDHYERGGMLTDRQIDAGWALTRLYQQGFRDDIAMCRYGAAPKQSTDEQDEERTKARREYDALANLIPYDCRHAVACMVRGEFPRMAMRIEYLRRACDVVADALDLARMGA